MSIKSIFTETFKDAPIVGTGAATLAGVRLDTWVLIVSLVYGLWRLVDLGITMYWKWQDHKEGKRVTSD